MILSLFSSLSSDISFQGPDWHYQTELPNWAKEDWDENAQEFGILVGK